MRRGKVNIPSDDWDLVYQTLSANRSSTMFDMSESDLFQLLAAAIYTMPDTPFLYIPIRYSDDSTLLFFLTNTVSVAVPTEIINDFLVN